MPSGTELDPETAARAFGGGAFNLLRRGGDGSLRLSMDKWRLDALTADGFRFIAGAEQQPLELARTDVARLEWDRLPKQHTRSQIRFYLANGDLWTFSGSFDEAVLPTR